MTPLCENHFWYLKGSDGQVKKDLVNFSYGFTGRDKDHVVDPKQRDQQESGFGQTPEGESEGRVRGLVVITVELKQILQLLVLVGVLRAHNQTFTPLHSKKSSVRRLNMR